MTPCVAQACVLPAPFAEDVAAAAEAGCKSVELWLTKLEQYLKTEPAAAAIRLVGDAGITFPAAAYQGGLLLSQGDARRAAFDLLKRRLDLCQRFAVKTLLLVADFAGPVDEQSLGRAVVGLTEAGRWAAAFDCRIALEFRAETGFCTCLETAALLARQCGEDNVGVCLDLFHFTKGPSKLSDIAPAADRIFHAQLCDVPGVPRELMAESDRVFPGEGDFDTAGVLRELRAAGYAGPASVELFNPVLWKAKPSQVYELAAAAAARALGG